MTNNYKISSSSNVQTGTGHLKKTGKTFYMSVVHGNGDTHRILGPDYGDWDEENLARQFTKSSESRLLKAKLSLNSATLEERFCGIGSWLENFKITNFDMAAAI